MGKKKLNRDLALKVLEVVGAVKDALDDLLDTMFIIYQPDLTQAVSVPAQVTLKVVAMNVAAYQWQYSSDGESWTDFGSSVVGSTSPEVVVSVTNTNKNRYRRCRLTDADGNIIYTVVGKLTIIT